MKIKSRLTGLEQTVSQETFEKMEEMKPGLHRKIADDVPTPPEAAEPEPEAASTSGKNSKKQTVLPAGSATPPDTAVTA